MVNGIIASPFGGNHMVANLFYNIHRFVYALSPLMLTSTLLHTANEVIYITGNKLYYIHYNDGSVHLSFYLTINKIIYFLP